MAMTNYIKLIRCFAVLAIGIIFYSSVVNAGESFNDVVPKMGFSGFAPPVTFSDNADTNENKYWRSGSSFHELNKFHYAPPETSVNPWRPVAVMSYNKSFGGRRPWGNVPDVRPVNTNNTKLYDQQFKQWIHQQGLPSERSLIVSDPFNSYALPTYSFPGSGYIDPLMTPSFYPGPMYSSPGPGYINPLITPSIYPITYYPYRNLFTRPWGW